LTSTTSEARRGTLERVRAGVAAASTGTLGAAPHVLHHAGPLAGTALLAGATGKLLFSVLGLALAVPMLRRLRRRSRSWRPPAAALAAMAVLFLVSTFVIGPALTGGSDAGPSEAPSGSPSHTGHDAHQP
jgi:hypothetical protein